MKFTTKTEVLSRMKQARSWNELGISICDVCAILEKEEENSNAGKEIVDYEAELEELRNKNARLTETNKQLRAENKALKSGVKKE